MRERKTRDEKAGRGPRPRTCEEMENGSEPKRENRGRTASANVPAPVFSQLRAAAEEQFTSSHVPSEVIGEGSLEQLVHELRVHQVELEMQNDELRGAQLALEDSRGKYVDLFDFAPVGYFTLTREDLIAEANLTGAALLGVVRHNLVNHRFGRFVAPEDLARWDRHLTSVFEQGMEQTCELALRREDGSTFHARLDSSRTGASGATALVRTAVSDITERRRAEEDLRAANARLEQAVARAEELAVRAEAANRAKSEFLANMSHEIRTPMTAILGFSDLLMAPNLPYAQQREFFTGIQSNGKALLELISDILDLSRIEADRLTLDKVDYPVRQIIDDVLSVVRVRAEEKGLALEVDYAFPLPETIHTDPVRLRQVLTNLMGNAVKFTQRGSVRIAVRHTCETDRSARVRFAISDTGIGIPADKIGELFEPFMQVDGSSTRRYGGTGLGLAISRRLAKVLGGDVEVSSQLGEGSTFTVTIDAGPLEGVRMLQSHQVPATAEKQPPVTKQDVLLHGRVLLAEDVPDIYVVLRQILQMMNLELEIAEDGRVACEMVERSKAEGRPFDLILMDIQMPRMNGYEATQWLRQHDWQGPIVALTAHALVGDSEKCLAAGCDDYLAKPITGKGLRDVLTRYLGQPAAGTCPRGTPRPAHDSARLLDSGILDPSKVAALVDAFRGELPARAERIGRASEQRNRTLLFELAHQLKGSAGVYGFDNIAETAGAICDRLRAGHEWKEVQAAVSELAALCGQAARGEPAARAIEVVPQ